MDYTVELMLRGRHLTSLGTRSYSGLAPGGVSHKPHTTQVGLGRLTNFATIDYIAQWFGWRFGG